jgi:hypothetical protein
MLNGKVARRAALAALLLGVMGVLWYPTDEKRVKEAADAIADGANAGPRELALALEQYAVADVRLSAADLPLAISGRNAIVELVSQAAETGQKLHLRVEAVEVTVEGNHARLNADLVATQAEVPELRVPRHSVALFEKRNGRFRLVSAEIGSERRDQPEARP